MIKIRPLEENDRNIVRQICCDVADRGEPIENFFSDREFAADLLTGYYINYEPEHSFVAEKDGMVIGYINGCFDNRRYGLALLFLIFPQLIIKGLVRGVFFRQEFLQIFKGMLKNWKRIFIWRKRSFHSHQGHLHIGVMKGFRSQQVGRLLAEALIVSARMNHIDELMASVQEENLAACRFFEGLGFVAKDRYSMTMAYYGSFKNYISVSYVKTIN